MQRLIVLGILLVAAVAGSWLGAFARPAQESGDAVKKPTKDGGYGPCDTKVCPVYFWGKMGTSCIYYSIRCINNEPCALTGTCSVPYPRYCNNCDQCVDVGMWFLKEKERKLPKDDPLVLRLSKQHFQHHYTHPDLINGIDPTPDPDPDAVIQGSKEQTKFVLDPFLVNLERKADKTTSKVRLYTARVAPGGDYPPRIFGVGLEVTTGDTTKVTVPYKNIARTNGQVVIVHVANVCYQVLLNKGSEVDPVAP